MSNFQRVLQVWAEEQRDTSPLLARIEQIRALNAQVYENLDSDPHICEEMMQRFAEHLVADMNASIERVFLAFCYSTTNCRNGPIREAACGHFFGRVQSAEVLLDNKFRRDPTDIIVSDDSGEVWLDALVRSDLQSQKVKLGGSLPLTRPCRTVWSWFQESAPHDPFVNAPKTRDLVRRLGLSYGAAEKLVCWGHVLDDSRKPHWPTAFDADLNGLFRPGGRTKPLDAQGEPHDGFDEVVHEQLIASDLTIGISILS
jgi:hypothetical protein